MKRSRSSHRLQVPENSPNVMERAYVALTRMFPTCTAATHGVLFQRLLDQLHQSTSPQTPELALQSLASGKYEPSTVSACMHVINSMRKDYIDGSVHKGLLTLEEASAAREIALSGPGVFDIHSIKKVGNVTAASFTNAKVDKPPAILASFLQSNAALEMAEEALLNLDTACQLLLPCTAGEHGAGEEKTRFQKHQKGPGITVSSDIDFGMQYVVENTAKFDDLCEDMWNIGLGRSFSLSPSEPRLTWSTMEAPVDFATITIRHHNSSSIPCAWVLGGIAAPSLPERFKVVDAAHLFGNSVHSSSPLSISITPGQQHRVTVALCRLMLPENFHWNAMTGVMQQALLFYIAVPNDKASLLFAGASSCGQDSIVRRHVNDVHHAPGWEVLVVARRISVALLPRTAHATLMALDVEARPFIPDYLRRIFNTGPLLPQDFYCRFSKCSVDVLNADVRWLSVPAGLKQSMVQSMVLQQSEKRSVTNNPHVSFDLIGKYHRLLDMEEGTMEKDIGRYDLFNSRIGVAIFSGPRRQKPGSAKGMNSKEEMPDWSPLYISLKVVTAHLKGSMADRGQRNDTRRVYRGPRIESLGLQPLRESKTRNMAAYSLGMITVPGLPEGRPAVGMGDCIHLRCAHDPKHIEFVGLVASTEGNTVFCVLPHGFWKFTGLDTAMSQVLGHLPGCPPVLGLVPSGSQFDGRVHVRFSFDRRSFEVMHSALERYAQLKYAAGLHSRCPIDKVTTPTASLPHLPTKREIGETLFLTKRLNDEQQEAVLAVLNGAGRKGSPCTIHGPPGTGKTLTLVACVLSLLSNFPDAKILCCAPQNFSADIVASSLLASGLPQSDILRLNDPRRPPFTVKQDVLSLCCIDPHSGTFLTFDTPLNNFDAAAFKRYAMLRDRLAKARVVVTTCIGASLLWRRALDTNNHHQAPHARFSHVFIDEAGQALLPEALIPLTLPGLHEEMPAAIVCGDPRQLGPIVRDVTAASSGLSTSLLEMLMDGIDICDPDIEKKKSHQNLMLRLNYRSSETLLQLPSKLFYGNSLKAAADPQSVMAPRWDFTQQQGMTVKGETLPESTPMLFYGVRGQQQREGDVASYENSLEAAAVVDLVAGLLSQKRVAGIGLEDIGIMSTYRRQVQTIRVLLRQKGLGAIRVGTVDDYQGQEERVIFISTVLSRPASLPGRGGTADHTHTALWSNPKRFNVAITRAKALLVVVGHPLVLLEDGCWKELLRQCVARGTFCGAGADALHRRLDRVGSRINHDEDEFSGIDHQLHCNEVKVKVEVNEEEKELEIDLQSTIDRLADLALLGSGSSSMMYPETMEEAQAAFAEEMEWRVML